MDILESIKWKKRPRKIISDKSCYTMTFGWVRHLFKKTSGYSKATQDNWEAYQRLIKFGEEHVKHPFDHITVNKNVLCKPHKDKFNQGDTTIFGFGDYTGGEICVDGIDHDIKNKSLTFNGKKELHWVKPFDGTRYTIVYYCAK